MLVARFPKPAKKGGFGLVKGLSKNGIRLLTSKSMESVLSGQRVMSTAFLKSIKLPNNFGMEFKITLEAIRNNIEVIEIPVNIRHRETGRSISGFIHRGKQFVNILNVLIKEMV
jgi:carbamoylphosphate synthase large subunit